MEKKLYEIIQNSIIIIMYLVMRVRTRLLIRIVKNTYLELNQFLYPHKDKGRHHSICKIFSSMILKYYLILLNILDNQHYQNQQAIVSFFVCSFPSINHSMQKNENIFQIIV